MGILVGFCLIIKVNDLDPNNKKKTIKINPDSTQLISIIKSLLSQIRKIETVNQLIFNSNSFHD